jgi:chemotaxis protein MotB
MCRPPYRLLFVPAAAIALGGCSAHSKLALRDAEIAALKVEIGAMQQEVERLRREHIDSQQRVEQADARVENLERELRDLAEREKLYIEQLEGCTVLRVPEQVLFYSGSADITPDGEKLLERISEILTRYPDREIRVEGHTDDVPISEPMKVKFFSNWELSTARATSTVRYMMWKFKMAPSRFIAVGYGEHRPIVPNESAEARSLNRRVEFHIAKPPPIEDLGE